MPQRFAKWKRDAESWFIEDSLMFEGLLGKVADDLVCSRSTGTPVKHIMIFLNTRQTESIDRASVLPYLQTSVNTTFQNASRPGLLVTCCRC